MVVLTDNGDTCVGPTPNVATVFRLPQELPHCPQSQSVATAAACCHSNAHGHDGRFQYGRDSSSSYCKGGGRPRRERSLRSSLEDEIRLAHDDVNINIEPSRLFFHLNCSIMTLLLLLMN